jgi:hypothetical protein
LVSLLNPAHPFLGSLPNCSSFWSECLPFWASGRASAGLLAASKRYGLSEVSLHWLAA